LAQNVIVPAITPPILLKIAVKMHN